MKEKTMKALPLAILATVAMGSTAVAQDPAPPAIVAHSAVHTQTVTHNDGRKHRQITHVRHRTIVKTPQGTMVRTTTSTTSTPPK
jgi:hypothetical protein